MKELGRPEFHPETVVECPGVHVLEKVWEEAGLLIYISICIYILIYPYFFDLDILYIYEKKKGLRHIRFCV